MKDRVSLRDSVVENSRFGLVRVRLACFRNYHDASVELDSGFNVLTGSNAQGKTNFLEALALLSTARLLRGQKDAEGILEGFDQAKVEGDLLQSNTTIAVTLERGTRKRASLNGLGLPRASDLLGRLPCVCVTTEDMEIVRGEPADRRLFLDLDLSALYPSYLQHLTLYKRALEQRNALLRHAHHHDVSADLFEPWEDHLALHGAGIRHVREDYVVNLSAPAGETHKEMGDGEELSLSYQVKDEALDTEALRNAFAQHRAADIHRGTTGIGPHRDDVAIFIGGKEARLYGSQGQQRTAVISLKLGSLKVVTRQLGAAPMLLLDDILSDLDERRRALLVEAVLTQAGQAVLTCTEASAAGKRILDQARIFSVKAGAIERQ